MWDRSMGDSGILWACDRVVTRSGRGMELGEERGGAYGFGVRRERGLFGKVLRESDGKSSSGLGEWERVRRGGP
jgi:hypothetical protein